MISKYLFINLFKKIKASAELDSPQEENEADRYYFNSLYQQQQAFQAQPLKHLRETHHNSDGDDGYYGDEEESQLIQRSVNSKLIASTARASEEESVTPQPLDKSTENITIKVGQQAVLPCFINNLGSSKVSRFSYFLIELIP